jgi:hypothetical protein
LFAGLDAEVGVGHFLHSISGSFMLICLATNPTTVSTISISYGSERSWVKMFQRCLCGWWWRRNGNPNLPGQQRRLRSKGTATTTTTTLGATRVLPHSPWPRCRRPPDRQMAAAGRLRQLFFSFLRMVSSSSMLLVVSILSPMSCVAGPRYGCASTF